MLTEQLIFFYLVTGSWEGGRNQKNYLSRNLSQKIKSCMLNSAVNFSSDQRNLITRNCIDTILTVSLFMSRIIWILFSFSVQNISLGEHFLLLTSCSNFSFFFEVFALRWKDSIFTDLTLTKPWWQSFLSFSRQLVLIHEVVINSINYYPIKLVAKENLGQNEIQFW